MFILSYQGQAMHIRVNYQLARVRRDLDELAAAKLLCNPVDVLADAGCRCNCGAGADENRLHLAVNFGNGIHLNVCLLKEMAGHV